MFSWMHRISLLIHFHCAHQSEEKLFLINIWLKILVPDVDYCGFFSIWDKSIQILVQLLKTRDRGYFVPVKVVYFPSVVNSSNRIVFFQANGFSVSFNIFAADMEELLFNTSQGKEKAQALKLCMDIAILIKKVQPQKSAKKGDTILSVFSTLSESTAPTAMYLPVYSQKASIYRGLKLFEYLSLNSKPMILNWASQFFKTPHSLMFGSFLGFVDFEASLYGQYFYAFDLTAVRSQAMQQVHNCRSLVQFSRNSVGLVPWKTAETAQLH